MRANPAIPVVERDRPNERSVRLWWDPGRSRGAARGVRAAQLGSEAILDGGCSLVGRKGGMDLWWRGR